MSKDKLLKALFGPYVEQHLCAIDKRENLINETALNIADKTGGDWFAIRSELSKLSSDLDDIQRSLDQNIEEAKASRNKHARQSEGASSGRIIETTAYRYAKVYLRRMYANEKLKNPKFRKTETANAEGLAAMAKEAQTQLPDELKNYWAEAGPHAVERALRNWEPPRNDNGEIDLSLLTLEYLMK